jgi:alpha-amylase/alpha-mannosidase (GH57 family)
MDKVHFLFGVHNHQPIGNFDFVFEKAYRQSYLPFLDAMERHPVLHWNLHATGILWEWLESHHPDYLDRIARQVEEERLEILTGGYYEPILPALPDEDKSGQIQKLTRYIQKRFKTTPRGMWLAERVWEPHLPLILHQNRIEYTLVDDSHFLMTGMTEDQLDGAFLSEEQGSSVLVLPIRKELRYAIPFRDPGETLNLLRRYVTPTGYRALVMFDDGEKFGLWPDTYKHVYEEGWLDRFLTVLESNADWISCSRISDYLKQSPPHGRVYLPTTSYYEMSEWTLPAESQDALNGLLKAHPHDAESAKRFLHGGFWRNFLTKYEEANNLHKKMLWVSEKVHHVATQPGSEVQRASTRAQKMLDALWAGQCNCAYWHGVFGGLYLPHLRQAIYRELLEAETLADRAAHAPEIQILQKDFDMDGRKEVLIESTTQNVYLNPHEGGCLFEWDLRAQGINLQNVLTRRTEGYHKQLIEFQRHGGSAHPGGVKTIHDLVRVKEPGLEKRLFTDWYRRTSLLDHFLHFDTTVDDFYRCQYGEQGDFIKSAYEVDIAKSQIPKVSLSRVGNVWMGDQRNSILIEKTVQLKSPTGWQVSYRFKNVEGVRCDIWYGCEMNFAFSSQDVQAPNDHGPLEVWQRRDHGFGIVLKVQFDHPMTCWDFPLETISLSEEGFERTYQGTVLLAHQRLVLEPGETISRSWNVEVTPE